MTESNKMTGAQLSQDKTQDRLPEKVQQRYFSELAKYQEQIRKNQNEDGEDRAA
jgi:hypothetical protein